MFESPKTSRSGGIGRRSGFKIHRPQGRTGSSPVFGTKNRALRRLRGAQRPLKRGHVRPVGGSWAISSEAGPLGSRAPGERAPGPSSGFRRGPEGLLEAACRARGLNQCGAAHVTDGRMGAARYLNWGTAARARPAHEFSLEQRAAGSECTRPSLTANSTGMHCANQGWSPANFTNVVVVSSTLPAAAFVEGRLRRMNNDQHGPDLLAAIHHPAHGGR